MDAGNVKWVRLGDYIEHIDQILDGGKIGTNILDLICPKQRP